MRGKVHKNGSVVNDTGITPAYAGKRQDGALHLHKARDHPRVCGEKLYDQMQEQAGKGSPPRMRGKGGRWPESVAANGITPAYAGKRQEVRGSDIILEDHPRVCGEKAPSGRPRSRRKGSPPRMRGKAEPVEVVELPGGITPAYAGKSG